MSTEIQIAPGVDAASSREMTALENRVRDYMLKRRELLIIELSYIEDELRMPRTKEKRVRVGGD